LSARNDWSSTLPEENNSFFYPSANVSLVFTDVMNAPKWLNFGKLRFGYGLTGNDASPYSIQSVFSQASYDIPFQSLDFPLASGINAFGAGNQIGNNALTPEITNELEIGTDLRLYDGRISVDFTYYSRLTNAQIISVPLDPTSGSTVIVSNAAKVSNKGIEALLSYRVLRREKGFNWTTSANFTRNRNNVEELDESIDKLSLGGLSTTGFYAMQGRPIGVYEGPSMKRTEDGQIVVGGDGVPVIGEEKEIHGNAQRNYILGFSNNFSYKQFSLGVLFDVRKGGSMYSHTASLIHWNGHATATTYNDRKPFIVPNSVKEAGQDENGDPIYVENDVAVAPADLHQYHTAEARDAQFVIDKSYTKLREVALSYRLPSSYMEKMPFAGASISIVGRNLFVWTPSENQFIDPEVTTFGNGNQAAFGEFGANPTTRSYGFTLNLNF
ncbi:TonB-dependent receptor, partial [Bacteroidia bacterium]|nr:TonB-dependent receptor [Bacteroidia bacterium]